jgi:hypothetical protein
VNPSQDYDVVLDFQYLTEEADKANTAGNSADKQALETFRNAQGYTLQTGILSLLIAEMIRNSNSN